MMRKLIILSILLISCINLHKIPNISLTNKYVTYNKVKIKIESKSFDNITLRGFINIIQDSLICFGFWGPLGYKVLSGDYGERFGLKDYHNNRNNSDVLTEIYNKSGIYFNRVCIENLLLARVDSLIQSLNVLNKGVIKLEKHLNKKCQLLTIMKGDRKSCYKLEFFYSNAIPRIIKISYNDLQDQWVAQIEIISISNEKKACDLKI